MGQIDFTRIDNRLQIVKKRALLENVCWNEIQRPYDCEAALEAAAEPSHWISLTVSQGVVGGQARTVI